MVEKITKEEFLKILEDAKKPLVRRRDLGSMLERLGQRQGQPKLGRQPIQQQAGRQPVARTQPVVPPVQPVNQGE